MVSWFSNQLFPALIGGFIGAVMMGVGWKAIQIPGLVKILFALFTSPFIGFIFGYLILKLLMLFSWNAKPRINRFFKGSQVLTGLVLALSHGANDAQNTMGIITLALVTGGYLREFMVPLWVILLSGGMISIGTSVGGWRLIRTLGGKFYRIRPADGFASQPVSAVVILSAPLFGGPVSTTQVVSSSIMGVGAAERKNNVRWGVAQEIATAWLLTIPSTALVGAGLYWVIIQIIH